MPIICLLCLRELEGKAGLGGVGCSPTCGDLGEGEEGGGAAGEHLFSRRCVVLREEAQPSSAWLFSPDMEGEVGVARLAARFGVVLAGLEERILGSFCT